MQHFILTRFNLLLWNKDKERQPVRTYAWLEHRFSLFERYCLPSIINQTCQSFQWIVLFDSKTPDSFKEKISAFQEKCPQLIPVFVEPQNGRYFSEIFRREVVSRLCEERVITTYLDNDDALDLRFVEDVQQRAENCDGGTFLFYSHGYQFFTDHNYVLKVFYRRNHFASVVECGDKSTVKTIYGYGSHYYIEKIKNAKVEYVKDHPMWCEIIHQRNMGNDAYFLWGTRMVKDENVLCREFAINETVRYGLGLYVFHFVPRYIKTYVRRIGYFFWGRHW